MDLNEIKKIIAKAEIENALIALDSVMNSSNSTNEFHTKLIQINSQFSYLQKSIINGTIYKNEETVERNKIIEKILVFIQELESMSKKSKTKSHFVERLSNLSDWILIFEAKEEFYNNVDESWEKLLNKLGLTINKRGVNLPGIRLERIDDKIGIGTRFDGMWMSGASIKGTIITFSTEEKVCELATHYNSIITRKYLYSVEKVNGNSLIRVRLKQYLTRFSISSTLLWLTGNLVYKNIARNSLKGIK